MRLLGVAIFAIIMVHSFNGEVDPAVSADRVAYLSALGYGSTAGPVGRSRNTFEYRGRHALRGDTDDQQIFYLRLRVLMFVTAGLALVSALVAFTLIENN